ncbi:DASH complex subunit Ask1-domain-containing protein [Aspergillus stella-maris]|uniref:DASH complex subunit Ask1-domain-containing protein n=1 Tax=Aspergillus stella-maris TaxID=1810926 RepID=UPI003CCCE7BA
MSRPSSMVGRPLTLTEELEKLEQSITLTLQEIDHNFSRAHRIVATGILPVVQQYSEASRDVREGAKFWKKFFEESANVALSGYGEEPEQETTVDETLPEDESADISQSQITESESAQIPSADRMDGRNPDDLDLTDLNLSSHSTPRAAQHDDPMNDSIVTSSIAHPSPYNDSAENDHDQHYQDDSYLPSTPGKQASRGTYDDIYDNDPMSSPFIPPVSTEKLRSARQDNSDPVMHRFADRTYRVQATPLGKGKGATYNPKFTATPQTKSATKYAFDDSPMSSPEPEAPQLNSELFSSPLKPQTPGTGRKPSRPRGPPKPGTSVLTPAKGGGGFGKRSEWDSDDDDDQFNDDDDLGYSPPKTMQFHIPQSRLMKTPAKEASRRIVEQLLYTAGANDTTEDYADEQSPSVIKRIERLEDDTF